jgi:tetratricopeptide (TPR) repeat protein
LSGELSGNLSDGANGGLHDDAPPAGPLAALGRQLAQWLALALMLLVAGWVLWQSQRLFRADWASLPERHQVLAWVSGNGAPATAAQWEQTRAALQASIDITPEDPALQERLGDLHGVAGQRDWADVSLRKLHFGRAAAHYKAAIALRPGEPQTWAMLAAAYQAMGAEPALVHDTWARALALGPFEGHVQPILMQVALADWPNASPAMQAWASELFDTGSEATRKDINVMAAAYGLRFSAEQKSLP